MDKKFTIDSENLAVPEVHTGKVTDVDEDDYQNDTVAIPEIHFHHKHEEKAHKITIKEARLNAGLTQQAMSDLMEIPKRTIEDWENNKRECPPYIERLIIKELTEIANNKD